jgi:Gpi18-like mannosyltransferase
MVDAATVPPTEQSSAGPPPVPPVSRFGDRHPGWVGMALVLFAGTVARVALSLRDGHLPDVDLFLQWMRRLVEHGLGGFYTVGGGCNYPPLYVLVLRALGAGLARLNPGLTDTALLRAALRLPACLADAGIAALLYVELRRLSGVRAGVLAAALYYLNPLALYNSAYWGQVDSIHAGLALAAVVALNRRRPTWAGVATALALLQKLQSIVFVPLILLDVYRWQRWRGLLRCAGGAVTATVLVLAPFAWQGTVRTALDHGYVHVVGQYSKLSQSAFNIWYLGGRPHIPDDSVPAGLVRTAARGGVEVADDASWLLRLTYRRIAMLLFVLVVAIVLTVYSRRTTPAARALAAGLLALAFFLCLTEMHERYAYPVIAVLPIWAVGGPWRERLYGLLSIALLLNLTATQPVEQIAADLAQLLMVLALVGLGALVWTNGRTAERAGAADAGHPSPADSGPPAPSRLVTGFGRLTLAAGVLALALAGVVSVRWWRTVESAPTGVCYLSSLTPSSQKQDYAQPARDRSVEGGVIYLGHRYYLNGVGTHAGATLVYALPEGYRVFRAQVGIDRHFRGSARIRVYLDDQLAFSSAPLHFEDPPTDLELPLGGAQRLKLVVSPNGSIKGAHVDWALARLEP